MELKPGRSFERDVLHLLALQGWAIQPEQLLLHKKVDGLAEKLGDFGETIRLAVECKDLAHAMTQQEVSEVYANYLPLLQKDCVDRVLLVTRHPVTPSAKTFTKGAKAFLQITEIELLNSLLDFSAYLRAMIDQ